MLWIAVDVAVALLAMTGLVLVGMKLWRQTKALSRTLRDAGESVAEASAAIPPVQRKASDT